MPKEDYFLLRESGNIGFYDYCDVVTIFLHHKKEGVYYNFFTLISFHEGKFEEYCKYITDKLITINCDISLGIIKYSLELSEIDIKFEQLLKSNSWEYKGVNLQLDDLDITPKKFVPISGDPNRLEEPFPINHIFNSCSDLDVCQYFIEFLPFGGESANISKLLIGKQLDMVCDFIFNKLRFDFKYLSDKIGTFIFKFQCSIYNFTPYQLNKDNGIILDLLLNKKIVNVKDYVLQIIQEFDGLVVHYEIENKDAEKRVEIKPNDVINKIMITDLRTNLIVFIFQMDLRYKDDYGYCILPTNLVFSVSQNFRTITDKDGNVTKIPLSNIQALGGGVYSSNVAIMRRQYSHSIQRLSKLKLLLMYRGHEHERAINDIRYILNNRAIRFDLEEICLWDPYLFSNHILETAYFLENPIVKIRAITCWQKAKEESPDKKVKKFIKTQKEWIENHSNNNGVALEFRCQHNQNGWGFHDRFLIIKHVVNRPRVWSLGTSLNSVGDNHHIIQAVENPQIIVDAFEELWNALFKEECLIYKSESKI